MVGLKTALSAMFLGCSLAPASAEVLHFQDEPNIFLAEKAIMAGSLERAAFYYRNALRSRLHQEKELHVLNNLCAVENALGAYEKAEASCTRAIRKKGVFWQAYLNRGNAFLAQGDLVAAKRDYAKAKKLKPSSAKPDIALAALKAHMRRTLAEK